MTAREQQEQLEAAFGRAPDEAPVQSSSASKPAPHSNLTLNDIEKANPCLLPEYTIRLNARTALTIPEAIKKAVNYSIGAVEFLTGHRIAADLQDPLHMFVSVYDSHGEKISEIHGLPMNKETGSVEITGGYDNELVALYNPRVSDAEYITLDTLKMNELELVMFLANAAHVANQINENQISYSPWKAGITDRFAHVANKIHETKFLPEFLKSKILKPFEKLGLDSFYKNSNYVAKQIWRAFGGQLPPTIQHHWFQATTQQAWAPGARTTPDDEALFEKTPYGSIEQIFETLGDDALQLYTELNAEQIRMAGEAMRDEAIGKKSPCTKKRDEIVRKIIAKLFPEIANIQPGHVGQTVIARNAPTPGLKAA